MYLLVFSCALHKVPWVIPKMWLEELLHSWGVTQWSQTKKYKSTSIIVTILQNCCIWIFFSFSSPRFGAWWQHIVLHSKCGPAPVCGHKPSVYWPASSWHAVPLPGYQHFPTLSVTQTRTWASELWGTRLKVWHLPPAAFCSCGGTKGFWVPKYPDHLHLPQLSAGDGCQWGWSQGKWPRWGLPRG